MKICYIATPHIHTDRWIRYYAERGHEVHLITSSDSYANQPDGINVHFLKRFGPRARVFNYLLNSLPMIFQFNRLLRQIKPDILHVHQIMDTALLGALSGFHPFVVTPWGSDVLIIPKQSRMSAWLVKYVLNKADLITCDADHVKEYLPNFGVNADKIEIIYFGTDVDRFNPGARDNDLRQELGIADSMAVISLRSFEPVYNIESLIEAVPQVLKRFPKVKFILAGSGTQESRLKEMASSMGLSDSINFVGRLNETQLPKYLASADVYVSTSLSDAGLAASTAEAMACGLPAVVTDFGDNGRWVEDNKGGVLVPLRDPEALASAIIRLLDDDELRKRFGQVNRQVIEERNNWKKEMDRMSDLYQAQVDKWRS